MWQVYGKVARLNETVILVATLFSWQPICNATQAEHASFIHNFEIA